MSAADSKPATLTVRHTQSGESAELTVMVDGGPLCIAGIWNWKDKCTIPGLYKIYHKKSTAHLGPFYASILLAEQGMKKALREVPKDIWCHDAEWYGGQGWITKWIDEHLGLPMDIVGGVWEKEPEKEKT